MLLSSGDSDKLYTPVQGRWRGLKRARRRAAPWQARCGRPPGCLTCPQRRAPRARAAFLACPHQCPPLSMTSQNQRLRQAKLRLMHLPRMAWERLSQQVHWAQQLQPGLTQRLWPGAPDLLPASYTARLAQHLRSDPAHMRCPRLLCLQVLRLRLWRARPQEQTQKYPSQGCLHPLTLTCTALLQQGLRSCQSRQRL